MRNPIKASNIDWFYIFFYNKVKLNKLTNTKKHHLTFPQIGNPYQDAPVSVSAKNWKLHGRRTKASLLRSYCSVRIEWMNFFSMCVCVCSDEIFAFGLNWKNNIFMRISVSIRRSRAEISRMRVSSLIVTFFFSLFAENFRFHAFEFNQYNGWVIVDVCFV